MLLLFWNPITLVDDREPNSMAASPAINYDVQRTLTSELLKDVGAPPPVLPLIALAMGVPPGPS